MTNDNDLINKTISDYNLIADKFSSTRKFISEDLINIAQQINKNQSILDYGCGNGRMAQFFSPSRYLGVDASESLIRLARKQCNSHKFELVEPSQFNDTWKFDNIICLSVIHHLPSKKTQIEFIKGLHNSLKVGGKIIITAWNKFQYNNRGLIDVPFGSEKTKIVRKIYAFSLSELTKIIENEGFRIVSAKCIPRNRGLHSNIEIKALK